MVFSGYGILTVGVLITLGNPIIGLLVVLVGGFISFTSTGIQIDVENKKYKHYSSYYGIKQGQWKTLDSYPCLAILQSRQSSTTHSIGNISSITNSENYYDIYLLDKTHRQKLLIKRLKNKEQASKDAKEFAENLGVEFTTYNPVISAKTRSRR